MIEKKKPPLENQEGISSNDLLIVYMEMLDKSLELNRKMLEELTFYRRAFPQNTSE